MDAINVASRGVGSNGGWASLVTGKVVDFGPDLSLFVDSRSDAYRLVDWVTPGRPNAISSDDSPDPRWKMVDRAHVDFRPSEPQWLQVKLIVEKEHEEVLQRLSSAIHYHDGYLDHAMIKWAIDPANNRQPYGMRVNDLVNELSLALPNVYAREPYFKPTHEERVALDDLAKKQELSLEAVMRQALRLYQMHTLRLREGETVTWSGDAQRMAEFSGGIVDG